jgi:hypothetical protein
VRNRRPPNMSTAPLHAEEGSHVRLILRPCGRIAPHFELVREQRREAHNVSPDTQKCRHIVTEGVRWPVASPVLDRGVDDPFVVPSEEREVKTCCFMDVVRIAILVGCGRVEPARVTEQFADPVEVLDPDRDIDIGMRSRQASGVEVDRPAAEYPIVDPLPLEQLVQLAEDDKLGFVVLVGVNHADQYGDPAAILCALGGRAASD